MYEAGWDQVNHQSESTGLFLHSKLPCYFELGPWNFVPLDALQISSCARTLHQALWTSRERCYSYCIYKVLPESFIGLCLPFFGTSKYLLSIFLSPLCALAKISFLIAFWSFCFFPFILIFLIKPQSVKGNAEELSFSKQL